MKNKTVIGIIRIMLALVTLIIINTSNICAQESGEESHLEVLFIGSSYFDYNDLPNIVYELAVNSDKEVYIDTHLEAGYLADHASSSTTAEKIKERKWDFIVLQGVGTLMAYPDYYTNHPVFQAISDLKAKIVSNWDSTRIVYCMPWAYEDGMTWLGWPDTYEDMQLLIYNRTLQYSDEIGFVIAPVGWAWYKVLDDLDYPLHYLHIRDWNHPSPKGSYIMACVIYSTIFIDSTSGNPFYGALSESDASYFQEISSNTVLNDTLLWKISNNILIDTTSNDIHKYNVYSGLLFQNYPNPFSSLTSIPYRISHNSFVEITVCDAFGRLRTTLLSEYKTPGDYTISYAAAGVPSGIYFYKIQTNNYSQIRKMQIIR